MMISYPFQASFCELNGKDCGDRGSISTIVVKICSSCTIFASGGAGNAGWTHNKNLFSHASQWNVCFGSQCHNPGSANFLSNLQTVRSIFSLEELQISNGSRLVLLKRCEVSSPTLMHYQCTSKKEGFPESTGSLSRIGVKVTERLSTSLLEELIIFCQLKR